MRILRKSFVVERGIREENGVPVLFSGLLATGVCSPAVADDEHYWFLRHSDAVIGDACRVNGDPKVDT